jgi:hypothetical protein
LSTGPIVERVQGKADIDMDTTWAVINDRFRVMARYAEEVVGPLVKQERARVDIATARLLKRAKRTLCREDQLIDEQSRRRISDIVDVSPVLKTIYEMRLALIEVWAKRGGNGDELLQAFKQWCVDAENSGIQALRDFVDDLKSYSVPSFSPTHA